MKYALVKTATEIGMGVNAKVNSVVMLFDDNFVAIKEAMKMYGCTVNDYAINGDLCSSYFECNNSTTGVVAEVFGNTDVVVIVVKSIDEKKNEVNDAD